MAQNSFEISGKIHEIFEIKQVSDAFRKREFVLEIDDNGYIQHVKFQTVQQRCELLDNFKPGDQVRIRFSLNGRPYTNPEGETIYFTNLNVWAIELDTSQPEQNIVSPFPEDAETFQSFGDEGEDDLPF